MRKFYHWLMYSMVTAMKYMSRYLPFIANPIVALYASQEVIACGMRDPDGTVRAIYTTTKDRGKHTVVIKNGGRWINKQVEPTTNYSGNLVQQLLILNVDIDSIFRVVATKISSGRTLRSPKITVKQLTTTNNDILNVQIKDTEAHITWTPPKDCNPMIYFLIIEDESGQTLSAIYTRENFWIYPRTKVASLSVGNLNPPALQMNVRYQVNLLIVDFDGWVSCQARKEFQY